MPVMTEADIREMTDEELQAALKNARRSKKHSLNSYNKGGLVTIMTSRIDKINAELRRRKD